MLNRILYFFIVFSFTIFLHTSETHKGQLQCVNELQPTLATLQQLPEIAALIEHILQDGPLTIQYNHSLSTKFMGYWDLYHRTILMTDTSDQGRADRIATMLFEMHNALRTDDFKEIDSLAFNRKITQEEYTRRSEYIEYENCLATARLLDIGIERGIFPKACAWVIHDNFEDHYRWMKQSGHAAWYTATYQRMHF